MPVKIGKLGIVTCKCQELYFLIIVHYFKAS